MTDKDLIKSLKVTHEQILLMTQSVMLLCEQIEIVNAKVDKIIELMTKEDVFFENEEKVTLDSTSKPKYIETKTL